MLYYICTQRCADIQTVKRNKEENEMSDKTVGIIGQKYEDRKTGKCGVLESRDDKYKTLRFRAEDGSTFDISNSSFRSNWRKVKEEVVNTEPIETESVAEEVVEQEEVTESEPIKDELKEKKKRKSKTTKKESEPTPSKNYDGVSNEEAIATFIESIMRVRDIKVLNTPNALEIFADDIIVIRIRYVAGDIYNLAMLPDVFTLTDWRGKLNTLSIQYKTGAENYLGVIVDTKKSCIPEILDIITETVKDINLYGYTEEDEDSEEETNGEN